MADQISGFFSPFLRRKRLTQVLPYVTSTSGRILDYGCGVGFLSQYIDSTRYLGVDIDEDSIGIASRQYSNHHFFKIQDVNELNGKFDVIVSLAVIEHISKPELLLAEFKPLLAENGIVVLTTPHPNFEWIHHWGSKLRLFSHGADEEHETLIDLKKMQEISILSGFSIQKYKRFLFFANQLFILKG